MAQPVRRDLAREPRAARGALDHAPARTPVERPSVLREEHELALAAGQHLRAAVRQPALQRRARAAAERHEARLPALAGQREHAQRGLDRARAQANGLADARAACVQHLQQGAIALHAPGRRRPGRVRGCEQPLDLRRGEDVRQRARAPRTLEVHERVGRELALLHAMAQTHAHGRERARHAGLGRAPAAQVLQVPDHEREVHAREPAHPAGAGVGEETCEVSAVGDQRVARQPGLDPQRLEEVLQAARELVHARTPRGGRACSIRPAHGRLPSLRGTPADKRQLLEGSGGRAYTPAPQKSGVARRGGVPPTVSRSATAATTVRSSTRSLRRPLDALLDECPRS